MTANSTLLATQCAAVVAVPQRCQPPSRFATGYQQLRTNLVTTKTYKPTIMAAGALVSKPSQLHANSVPKRNKMVIFAYPETKTIEISTNGFPEFIECRINNESKKTLELDSSEPFLGSEEFDGIEYIVDTTSSFSNKQQVKVQIGVPLDMLPTKSKKTLGGLLPGEMQWMSGTRSILQSFAEQRKVPPKNLLGNPLNIAVSMTTIGTLQMLKLIQPALGQL